MTNRKMRSKPPGYYINLIMSFFCILMGINCLWSGIREYFHPFAELEHTTLITVAGKLSRKPNIHTSRSQQVRISIEEYPNSIFSIYELYSSTDISGIASELNAGDSVLMDITKDDYNKYIAKTVPLTFNEKHLASGYLTIYGLCNTKDRWYLDVRPSYPELERGPVAGLLFFLLSGIGIGIIGVRGVSKTIKSATEQ